MHKIMSLNQLMLIKNQFFILMPL